MTATPTQIRHAISTYVAAAFTAAKGMADIVAVLQTLDPETATPGMFGIRGVPYTDEVAMLVATETHRDCFGNTAARFSTPAANAALMALHAAIRGDLLEAKARAHGVIFGSGLLADHTRDEDCTVGEDYCCTGCGVSHAEHGCDDCGGHAFHRLGCPESDEHEPREGLTTSVAADTVGA